LKTGEFHFTGSHCRFHEANRKPIGVDLRQRDDRRRERHRAIWPGVLEVDSRGPRAGMASIVAIEERSRPGTGRRKSVRVIWTVPRVGRSRDHSNVIPTTLHHCMQIKSSILVWSFICTLDEGLARGICRITSESSIFARPLRQGRHPPWSSTLHCGGERERCNANRTQSFWSE
jgi:hypothetical protein